MKCSRYVNVDRMDLRLNGGSFEVVDSFKYPGSQVAVDGGCKRDLVHRINEKYIGYGWLEILSVLTEENLGLMRRSGYT